MIEKTSTNKNFISIRKAREHNLKGIDLDIARGKFIVITGLSGSGKSSLAFDTIYAEGQRRYIESLSSYARQFLDQMEKPDVESITGLTPTIAIEQKTRGATPRSTVATSTEIYDYMRVLFARVGDASCYKCGRKISTQSAEDIAHYLLQYPPQTSIQILSPLVRSAKGEHKEIFKKLLREGFARARVNQEIYDLEEVPNLDKKFNHNIDAVIDRIVLKEKVKSRLSESVEIALQMSQGLISVLRKEAKQTDTKQKDVSQKEEWQEEMFSENFTCPEHGMLLPEISPRVFSFNSPFGACQKCNGLGNFLEPDENLVVPDKNLSLKDGAIYAWRRCGYFRYAGRLTRKICRVFKIESTSPWKDLSRETQKAILHGGKSFEGVIPELLNRFYYTNSEYRKKTIHEFMTVKKCPVCDGARLKKEVLAVRIQKKNIAELNQMTVEDAEQFFKNLSFDKEKQIIVEPLKKAILEKLSFLNSVGLNYLSLNRETNSLSGGESQRIRLACQLGSQLAGVTYVLDEPTIGLHQRDNQRLIQTLQKLQAYDNTVIVVEHDRDLIMTADEVIDIGPGAGVHGGEIVAQETPKKLLQGNGLTAKYLRQELQIPLPERRRELTEKQIKLVGCKANNLKNADIVFPLGIFVCLTGVSGSGKSSLAIECLYKNLKHKNSRLHLSETQKNAGKIKQIKGVENIDKIIFVDQSPIGRTSRSNPATYTGVFDPIRKLFTMTPEAKTRGYQPGRFSFNVKGGRCEACQGQGQKSIEMYFLPDVHVVCEACNGKRYNSETLEVKFRGKNIAQILDMTIEIAKDFFKNHRNIYPYLETLDRIGLGYIKLGQPAPSLSGGEAQRVKLSSELSRASTAKTLYLMDEPTTGLHFHDIYKLMEIIQDLVNQNNTVIVIEHNLDIIKCADWIIDLGPEGGAGGGKIIAQGTPEEIAKNKASFTGHFLKDVLTTSKRKAS